jgi:hypothetical protein
LFYIDFKTFKGKTILLGYMAGSGEIPAYAGMTMRIYFGKKRRGNRHSHASGKLYACRAAFSLQAESHVIPA